ncbi:MAG TPA: SoxR reducing system RseC family protein [Rectinemataceae bacterium]|nr:SoxR reducing system RseC family protein [Rectinemataceae bacterium]
MRETATVKKINGKLVNVAIAMHDGCASCVNNSCKNGRSDLQSYNAHGIDVIEGDEVEIEISGSEQAKGAFWILGLPLVALFAGYGLGRLFFPTTTEAPAVICAGVSFAVTLALGALLQKSRKYDSLPVIIRKCGA